MNEFNEENILAQFKGKHLFRLMMRKRNLTYSRALFRAYSRCENEFKNRTDLIKACKAGVIEQHHEFRKKIGLEKD